MEDKLRPSNPPIFWEEIPKVDLQDFITADTENEIKQKLLNNDVFIKLYFERLIEEIGESLKDLTQKDTEFTKELTDTKETLTNHKKDSVSHITAEERKQWNEAEPNQNAFSTVKVGKVQIISDGKQGFFSIEAGSKNVTIQADNATKKVTISVSGGNADTLGNYNIDQILALGRAIVASTLRTTGDISVDYPHAIHVRHIEGASDQALYFNYAHPNQPIMLGNGGHQIKDNGANYTGNAATASNAKSADAAPWNGITGKPSTYPPSGHTHTANQISGLPTSLPANGGTAASVPWNGITGKPNTYPPSGHNHDDRYYTEDEVNNLLSAKAPKGNPAFDNSVSMGRKANTTIGSFSTALGIGETASGYASQAFGSETIVSGELAAAFGDSTKASGWCHFAIGRFNVDNVEARKCLNPFMIGNGGSDAARSNAFRVAIDGRVYCAGNYNSGGADYAEYFEWQDGNPSKEDRVGHFVTLVDRKIKIATKGDYLLGIVSAFPCLIGNSDEDWQGRWKKDDFGRILREEVQVPIIKREELKKPILDEEGKETGEYQVVGIREVETGEFTTELRPIPVPNYDSNRKYIERKDRPEWAAIGMLGVLRVYDDGTCQANGYCQVAEGGIATATEGEYTLVDGKIVKGYRVTQRITEDIIEIIFK